VVVSVQRLRGRREDVMFCSGKPRGGCQTERQLAS